MEEIRTEAEWMIRETFANHDQTKEVLGELKQWREKLTRLEDLYLDADIDKSRYLLRKADIDQHISNLEDKLYSITETVNFNQILNRITGTLTKLSQATPETKKTPD